MSCGLLPAFLLSSEGNRIMHIAGITSFSGAGEIA